MRKGGNAKWRLAWQQAGRKAAVGYALTIACFCAVAQPQQGQAREDAQVGPPDVFLEVVRLQYELAALRYVAGESATAVGAPLEIAAAVPRHVFYQAQVLFRKVSQLSEDVAAGRRLPLEEVNAEWRRTSPRPVPAGREVVPADVLPVITDTRDRVRAMLLLSRVNISMQDPPQRDPLKQPSDVLIEIIEANRQLNRMMHREFRMRDVFDQVLLAINYAGDLGAGYPSRTSVTDNRRPLDVAEGLLACSSLLRQVGATQQVQVLDLRLSGIGASSVTAADVYDLATILISDLEYMTQRANMPQTSLPRGEYRAPRFVAPADVSELVRVLETQLRTLATAAGTVDRLPAGQGGG